MIGEETFLWFFTNSIIERYNSFLAINSTETVGPWKPLTDRNFGELLPRQILSESHGLRQVFSHPFSSWSVFFNPLFSDWIESSNICSV